jgi:hypothetical protein
MATDESRTCSMGRLADVKDSPENSDASGSEPIKYIRRLASAAAGSISGTVIGALVQVRMRTCIPLS